MKNIIIFIAAAFFIGNICVAQDAKPFVKKAFVIVQSTKNYNEAKVTAEIASRHLQQALNLRGLKASKKTGLTFADSVCENEGGYPCYIARGRFDDGDYVSIEWRNAIEGFAKGYYIVVVYSGDKGNAFNHLKKIKIIFKDAYIKVAEVYIGCMH